MGSGNKEALHRLALLSMGRLLMLLHHHLSDPDESCQLLFYILSNLDDNH